MLPYSHGVIRVYWIHEIHVDYCDLWSQHWSVCLSHRMAVQKRLNVAMFSLRWSLLGMQETMYKMGIPISHAEKRGSLLRPFSNYFGQFVVLQPIHSSHHCRSRATLLLLAHTHSKAMFPLQAATHHTAIRRAILQLHRQLMPWDNRCQISQKCHLVTLQVSLSANYLSGFPVSSSTVNSFRIK